MRLALYVFPFLTLTADQVTLMNGDVLTGTIVKKDGDKLSIKSEFLGEVTMPWSAVKSLRSDGPLTVVLPGGEAVQGPVSTTGNEMQVSAGGNTRTAPLSAVAAVRNASEQREYERMQHPGWFDLWAGSFDLGLALARGNARTDTLATNFTVVRETRSTKTMAHFNQIYGTARLNGVTSATASALRGAGHSTITSAVACSPAF